MHFFLFYLFNYRIRFACVFAGKSSLIDALSGRLFNGTVAGTIKVNGHHTTLEEHANIVGFVPKVGYQ